MRQGLPDQAARANQRHVPSGLDKSLNALDENVALRHAKREAHCDALLYLKWDEFNRLIGKSVDQVRSFQGRLCESSTPAPTSHPSACSTDGLRLVDHHSQCECRSPIHFVKENAWSVMRLTYRSTTTLPIPDRVSTYYTSGRF